MRYTLIFITLLLTNNLKAQCLDSLKGMFIVEKMPSCLDCKLDIETKLKQNISQFNLEGIDTMYVCYEINTQGGIQNVIIKGINNAPLTTAIYNTLSTVKTYSPAYKAGEPVDCPVLLMFILEHYNGTTKVKSILHNIWNKTELEYDTERLNEKYREYFKENSTEKIQYMNISLVESYIIQNVCKKRK